MTIVVLGGGGMLGRHVAEELRGRDVRALNRYQCNLASREAVIAATEPATVIVNCGAYTNVDGAEREEDTAYMANAIGAENAALAAREHKAQCIHISTDFVFDGTKATPYDELDVPNPISKYGRSKWAGEVLAQRVNPDVVIARVQGLYGAGGKNFSSKLKQLLREGRPLTLDKQRKVQPTWARAAARQIVRLIDAGARAATYHVACDGAASWAEFAHHLCRRLGATPAFREVETHEVGGTAAAPRPQMSLFERRILKLHGLDIMPTWNEALDEYFNEGRD